MIHFLKGAHERGLCFIISERGRTTLQSQNLTMQHNMSLADFKDVSDLLAESAPFTLTPEEMNLVYIHAHSHSGSKGVYFVLWLKYIHLFYF